MLKSGYDFFFLKILSMIIVVLLSQIGRILPGGKVGSKDSFDLQAHTLKMYINEKIQQNSLLHKEVVHDVHRKCLKKR